MSVLTQGHRGFILLPIMMLLAVLAGVALLINREGAINTGSVIREHQPDEIRYVADAALAIGQRELRQDTDCSGYTVTGSGTFNGYTYTASVTPVSGSPVTLTVNVDAGDGTTRQYSRQVTMYDGSTQEMILNPAQDTYINSSQKNRNYNSGPRGETLHVMFGSNLLEPDRVSFLQFDLQSFANLNIPIANIQSATLELHSSGTPESNVVNVKVNRVLVEWNENEATYNNRLISTSWGFYSSLSSADAIDVDESVIGWKTWTITSLVKDWLNGTYTNYGMALFGEAGNSNNLEFVSQNNPDTAKRPVLRITYSPTAVECP